jgi:hypothetical protein
VEQELFAPGGKVGRVNDHFFESGDLACFGVGAGVFTFVDHVLNSCEVSEAEV